MSHPTDKMSPGQQWILVSMLRLGDQASVQAERLRASYGAASTAWASQRLLPMQQRGLVEKLPCRQGWRLTHIGKTVAKQYDAIWPPDSEQSETVHTAAGTPLPKIPTPKRRDRVSKAEYSTAGKLKYAHGILDRIGKCRTIAEVRDLMDAAGFGGLVQK